MKKIVLYCDRCPEEHRATRKVWIRGTGLPRVLAVDVCEQVFSQIVGSSENGAAAPIEPKIAHQGGLGKSRKQGDLFMPNSDALKLAQRVRAALAKTPILTLDDLLARLELKPKDQHRLSRVTQALKRAGEILTGPQGLYRRADAPLPATTTDLNELRRRAVLLITKHPGIRARFIPPLVGSGLSSTGFSKGVLLGLRETGWVRIKGMRANAAYFPVRERAEPAPRSTARKRGDQASRSRPSAKAAD